MCSGSHKNAYIDINTQLEGWTGVQKGQKHPLTPEARTTEKVQDCWKQETPHTVTNTSLGFAGGLEYPGCSVDSVGPCHLLNRCFRTKGRYKLHPFPLRAQPRPWAVDPVQVLMLRGMQLTPSLRSEGMGQQQHRNVPRLAQAWPEQGEKLVSPGEEPARLTGQRKGQLKDTPSVPGHSPARSHHTVAPSYHLLPILGCSGKNTWAEGEGNSCYLPFPPFLAVVTRQYQ